MTSTSKPQKRWLASALKSASGNVPALPFQRGQRKSMAARMTPVQSKARALRSA
ncbi:hypothetical protein [Roseovarius sp. D0-M9]|uniref:hypothetical protein n=1 Tax=Roseovarius sp. D0-M9 TaxID=3127117 RepID=UPI00300FCD25